MTGSMARATADIDPREAILALARSAFAEKGFDGASMQDLARAAGMSAGNFYRYFPSKAAIVQAIVARETAMIGAGFAMIAASSAPLAAIHQLIRDRVLGDDARDCAVWAEIVAAAHRQPEIAQTIHAMEQEVIRLLTGLFAQLKGIDPVQSHKRFALSAHLMLIQVRGMEMERLPGKDPDPALLDLIIAEVTRTLNSILSEP
jgi:AcrR family transcriptional regulator